MNRFLSAVASVLAAEILDLDTPFRGVGGWCTPKALALLKMMEMDWDAPITMEKLLECNTVRDLWREAFFALAARIFGVDRASLDGTTSYESIPGWDSVNHLRLVMETERAFGVRYPLERIPSLTTLDDFLV